MICLIDADSLIYYSLPKKANKDATYEECIAEIDDRINTILKTCGTSEFILFLTVGKCFRYKAWKASRPYKYNRNKSNTLPPMFYAMKEYVIQKYNVLICKDLEADDMVSYFSTVFEKSMICSPDKDVLYQNEGTHFDYGNMKMVTVTKEEAERFLFHQLIVGDSTDGVSGIKGVGKITADKWFGEKDDKYSYAELVIDKYIDNYGIHEGIIKFYENFTMVYILKDEDDLLREIGYIPETPIIQQLANDKQIDYNVDDLI